MKFKHLASSNKSNARFVANTKVEAEVILKDAMRRGDILSIVDDGVSSLGNSKYLYTIDAGKTIGAGGETKILVSIADDGGMLSAYPTK